MQSNSSQSGFKKFKIPNVSRQKNPRILTSRTSNPLMNGNSAQGAIVQRETQQSMFEDDQTSLYTQNSNPGLTNVNEKSQSKVRKFRLPRAVRNQH